MRSSLKFVSLITTAFLAISIPECLLLNVQVAAIAQTTQTGKAEADQLYEQGKQQFRQGLYRESVQTFQRVVSLRQQQKDQLGEAEAITRLSEAFYWLGESQQATETAQVARKLWRELKNRQGEADALTRLAEAHNDNNKALEILQQALSLAQASSDRTGECSATITLTGSKGMTCPVMGSQRPMRSPVPHHQN